MWSMWVSGLTLCLLVALCGLSQGKEVYLPSHGTLNGTTTLSAWTNRTIYQYQGIPFAEPPVGRLRFKRPVPYRARWRKTFNATDFGPICHQKAVKILAKAVQSEDCLHINVYTTKTDGGGNGTGMPVMVFIHGGSFRVGSSRSYLPNYLLEHDVILAVPQYRLGPLGFLSLKTDEVPGNQGMLDVILALEWVQKNIEHFGGDPTRVTLCGQSAGAAAATLMMLSPLSRDGLFQRVIAQSGSALSPWVVDPDPFAHALKIAEHANCTHRDLSKLAKCLRDDTTADDIITAHYKFFFNELYNGKYYPVGGNHIVWNEAGDKSFLLDDPYDLVKTGKIKRMPLLGGVTKHEGSLFLGIFTESLTAKFHSTDWEQYLINDMTRILLEEFGIEDRTGFTARVIRDQYFTDNELGNVSKMTPGLIDIVGAGWIKAPTFTMVDVVSRDVPGYLYSFNFFGRFSLFRHETDTKWSHPFPPGVAHGDSLLYFFPHDYAQLDDNETTMAKKMVQYWTSFAANGVPKADGAPDWPKFSTGKGPYLKIELEPTVHDDFIDEYTIAVKEGLTPYYPPPSSASTTVTSILSIVISLVLHYSFKQTVD